MISIDAASSRPAVPAISDDADTSVGPRDVKQAAQQFEALLITELLRLAHGEEGGWLGTGEDSTASPAVGLAEESLAQSISANGGLGLSKLVAENLTKR
jgi:Rod binding domain-containing protein